MVRVRLLTFMVELRKMVAVSGGKDLKLVEGFLSEWVCGVVDEVSMTELYLPVTRSSLATSIFVFVLSAQGDVSEQTTLLPQLLHPSAKTEGCADPHPHLQMAGPGHRKDL